MISIKRAIGTLLIAAVGGAFGGCLGFLLAAHLASRVERISRAERFELVGKGGKVRAFWGQSRDGHVVTAFLDSQGSVRAEFGVGQDGAVQWLRMCGSDGRCRIRLGADDFSYASLTLGDDSHESRVVLGAIVGDVPARPLSWGLVFPRKGTFSDWAALGVREDSQTGRMTPFLSIRSSAGARWSAPLEE